MDTNERDNSDPVFMSLPTSVQRRIDRAFERVRADSVLEQSRPSKRRKVNRSEDVSADGGWFLAEDAPGGFVVDDSSSAGGFLIDETSVGDSGGFLLDEDEDVTSSSIPQYDTESDCIPFLLVPSALELLALPPDDPQVLSVFDNAASGWTEASGKRRGDGVVQGNDDAKVVSRKDWRAVCAVLLEGEAGSDEENAEAEAPVDAADGVMHTKMHEHDEDAGPSSRTRRRTGASKTQDVRYLEEDISDTSEDEYNNKVSDVDSPLTEDEYDTYVENGPAIRPQRKLGRNGRRRASDDSDDDEAEPRTLTSRQKAECRKAFALFFDVDDGTADDMLASKRIMIKDVSRVAKLLKEKISADEVSRSLYLV
jgi:hypothetical protein